jgi:Flp pilus assembly protein TadG
MSKSRVGTSFSSDSSGATALEFALIAFPLILLILGAIEGGRMLWMRNALQYAVERAARCAVVTPSTCGTLTQIQSYAASQDYSTSGATFSEPTPASCGTGTEVSASLVYTPLIPLPLSVTIAASSCRPGSS